MPSGDLFQLTMPSFRLITDTTEPVQLCVCGTKRKKKRTKEGKAFTFTFFRTWLNAKKERNSNVHKVYINA